MLKRSVVLGLLFSVAFILTSNQVSAQKRYSASKHSSSHGGHYSSGRGSSHKGGSYKNARTGNRYGRHKRNYFVIPRNEGSAWHCNNYSILLRC